MNDKLQDGILIFAKRECETCQMVEHVIGQIADKMPTVVYTQDDPSFPSTVSALDDSSLESSFAFNVEAVPTVVRMREGKEVARTFGWSRADWEKLTGLDRLGEGLPEMRPGCGSKSREPDVYDVLRAKYGKLDFKSRQIRLGEWDDEIEACFDRGWSDGLPVVPPTDVRILRMLEGTPRKPDEIIGAVPPNLSPITVEKVAVNAVMAGCRPEYMPVVLTALEAALDPLFTMHGLLCTTCFSSPIIVVNGPVAREIGMNSGINCLGQGNRANATIGRALQLIIRNVGGGRPGELDRAVLGGPGKYTFCFAEDESDKKPTNTRVAPREMIKDIADNCDAVIIALSDCGSCTSCSTHDLNDLDKKGLAGVSVLTTEFQQAFESQKGAIGLDAAAVYVPHPLQNKTTAELHQWANAAVDKILQAIAHDTSCVTALETV